MTLNRKNNFKDLLIICQYFYPERMTSAQLPYMTAKYLVNNGISVDVMCGEISNYIEKSHEYEERLVSGINIKRLKYLKVSKNGFFSRLINYFSIVFAFVFQIVSFRNYKVIMVYSNPPILPIIAVISKYLFKNKIVFVSYDVYPEIAINTNILKQESIIVKVMKIINNILFKNVDTVVALSNEMKTYLLINRKITEEKIDVIQNWATEDPYKSNDDNINEKFVISYFGNIGIAQDFEIVRETIEYFKNDEEISWVFAGHGTYYDDFRQFIKNKKVKNVEFKGYVSENELNSLAKNSSCFLLTLKNNLNGLAVPSKYYSYLNYGKPIIAVISEKSDIYNELSKFEIGKGINSYDKTELINVIKSMKDNRVTNKNYQDIYDYEFAPEIQLKKYLDLIIKLKR